MASGQKFDKDKAPAYQGVLAYFPRALKAVAFVSNAGARKYSDGQYPTQWREVPNGINRYSDAMARHIFLEGEGEVHDPETGMLHAAQVAWNALARLELYLIDQEKSAESKVEP